MAWAEEVKVSSFVGMEAASGCVVGLEGAVWLMVVGWRLRMSLVGLEGPSASWSWDGGAVEIVVGLEAGAMMCVGGGEERHVVGMEVEGQDARGDGG